MNQDLVAAQYRQTSARGRHPVGLVVKLYDAIIEDFRRALAAVLERQVQQRTSALNHALLVIAELESVLDHERGGDVARHLKGFYQVTRAMIVEENIRARAEGLEKLINLYLPVRQAWQEAERAMPPPKSAETGETKAAYAPDASEDGVFRTGWNG